MSGGSNDLRSFGSVFGNGNVELKVKVSVELDLGVGVLNDFGGFYGLFGTEFGKFGLVNLFGTGDG